MTASNDSKPPQRAKAKAAGAAYGIVRQEQTTRGGQSIGTWLASVRRSKLTLQRNFHDQVYGGRENALTWAAAWRNAVLRLIPPRTRQQNRARLRFNNISGVSGVAPTRIKGDIVGWRATLLAAGRYYSQTFSYKTYGKHAKEQAIAARERLLERYAINGFATRHEWATQEAKEYFGALLDDPQLALAPEQVAQRISDLNQWFDQQHFHRLLVNLGVYDRKGQSVARVHVTSVGAQSHVADKGLALTTQSYQQRLPELWQFIENTITAWHGGQRWQDFAAHYEQAFMSSDEQNGFKVRHYSPPPGYPECLKPPASLLPMLAGFELPALPYSAQAPKQQPAEQPKDEGVFLPSDDSHSGLAILPPLVKNPYQGNNR